MSRVYWHVVTVTAGCAALGLCLARPARALDIQPTFDSSIAGDSNAAAIEASIDTATHSIERLFSNPFDVPILFVATHAGSSFLAASESTFYGLDYGSYTSLLASAAAAHPGNKILNTAVAHLSPGNQGGTDGVIVTDTVLQALGVPGADVPGGFDANGDFTGDGSFDGVVFINLDLPLAFAQPVPAYNGGNLAYDATRGLEHEIDEVLGGGGSGSTLDAIADYGTDNPDDVFTFFEGALDLYRYSAPGAPSFTTDPAAAAYLSVDGGGTDIVGFNQDSNGDFGDFGPTVSSCGAGGYGGPPRLIQDAFSCYNQSGEAFTTASPEFAMLELIGYNGVPEPSTWATLLVGFAGVGLAARRRARVART